VEFTAQGMQEAEWQLFTKHFVLPDDDATRESLSVTPAWLIGGQ